MQASLTLHHVMHRDAHNSNNFSLTDFEPSLLAFWLCSVFMMQLVIRLDGVASSLVILHSSLRQLKVAWKGCKLC